MDEPQAIEHNGRSSGGKSPSAILFMCGLNTIRSPMAEAIARQMLPQGTYIASAGVRAGERNPFVDVVLSEMGLSLGRRQPQTLEELEDDFFDVIITLSPEAHHAALELTRANAIDVIYWPTMDPSATDGTRDQVLDAYRGVRDYLLGLIESRLVEHRGSL